MTTLDLFTDETNSGLSGCKVISPPFSGNLTVTVSGDIPSNGRLYVQPSSDGEFVYAMDEATTVNTAVDAAEQALNIAYRNGVSVIVNGLTVLSIHAPGTYTLTVTNMTAIRAWLSLAPASPLSVSVSF